jgi:carbon storage regulator CsrA
MLVLSRSRGQAIVIGGAIVVDVVSIGRGRVQLGITAPANLSVNREEVQKRIDQNPRAPRPNVEAAKSSSAGRRTVEMYVSPLPTAAVPHAGFFHGGGDGAAVGG